MSVGLIGATLVNYAGLFSLACWYQGWHNGITARSSIVKMSLLLFMVTFVELIAAAKYKKCASRQVQCMLHTGLLQLLLLISPNVHFSLRNEKSSNFVFL